MAVPVVIEHLTKRFGAYTAVRDISIEIQPGELFFLLGPSGCGKTTLLRCIAGLYEPDTGRVLMGGEDVTRQPPHERNAAMVFQSYALWPHLTIRENVAFGLEMRKQAKADVARRVDDVLAMVKMAEQADQRPNQLSGGQQQRVALARAIVTRPRCLLLDEPLSNLDAKLRLEMRVEIRRLCKEAGLTAVYVTHDQKEALSIADRLAVLKDGSIQQIGAPEDVYLNPASPFVANFIGETNNLKGVVETARDSVISVRTPLGLLESRHSVEPRPVPGARIAVSIRPEAIHFDEPPVGTEAANRFDGEIVESVYLGEIAQHQLRLPSAEGDGAEPVRLKAFHLNPRVIARDKAEPVRIWIHPRDVVLLDPAESE